MSDRLRIGVVGLGYWGPNLARNFHALAGSELVWCCDASPAARERAVADSAFFSRSTGRGRTSSAPAFVRRSLI